MNVKKSARQDTRKATGKAAATTRARASSAVAAWAAEVRQTLLQGGKYQAPGLGTFSTCARKAAPGRAACRMAMFRADPALRSALDAGELGNGRTPRDPVAALRHTLGKRGEVMVPGVGRVIVDDEGKKVRVLFRGDEGLNDALSA